jgi:acyl-CoA thioester hydrolase
MTTMTTPLDAFRARNQSRFAIQTAVRYGDLDANGHVNHARYLAHLEEGRLALRRAIYAQAALPMTVGWPVAELSVRYLRSVVYPATLVVEVGVLHVGRTSFTLGYGLHDETGIAVIASTRSVAVDRATGTPVALPEPIAAALRERLEPTA